MIGYQHKHSKLHDSHSEITAAQLLGFMAAQVGFGVSKRLERLWGGVKHKVKFIWHQLKQILQNDPWPKMTSNVLYLWLQLW